MSSTQSLKRAALSDKWLSFISPAKINLFFRVLYKREDGFHEIASLYQAINLCDTLYFNFSEKDLFTCSNSSLAMDDKNLIYKALELFRKKTGKQDPISIHLEKRIPMQAGLGGGSSNAATTLFALNQIFSTNLSQKELIELGSVLGSDVPFFFSSGTAYCTGRGEKLQELPFPKGLQSSCIWIAKPKIGLSTPLVYGACKPELLFQRDPKENFSLFYNDLEIAAFSICPELQMLKQILLESGFETVVLCGSGTAFFCIGSNQPPQIEGIEFFKTKSFSKENARWYEI
jgi:4-diphosphocytidyl-2-C-methyl-D-erythritol kinase